MSGASDYNSGIASMVACPVDILIGQSAANLPINMSMLPGYHARDVNR